MLRFTKGSVINLPGLCMCDEKDVIHDNLMPQLAARQWKSLSYTQKKATPRLTQTAAADKHLLQTLKKEHFWSFFFVVVAVILNLAPKKWLQKSKAGDLFNR